MITRRRLIKISAGTAGLGAAGGIYAWRIEPHWLEFTKVLLPIPDLPDDQVGLRMVQLSDLHIGTIVDDGYLLRSFQRVRDLVPDFVVYTGDFVNHDVRIGDHGRTVFPHLPLGRLGTFGVLGNHDYGSGWSREDVARHVVRSVGDVGVRILRNERVEVGGLHFIGMDELWAGRFDPGSALEGLPQRAAAVVLSHNPDTVDLPGWGAYSSWILSGHTHGGQCKPPFLPPPLLPVKNKRYSSGEFGLSGGRRLYVNRGIGYLKRVRFNVRPEITVFRLERA